MISFNEFCTKVVNAINEETNYVYEVKLQEFYKINNKYMGLVISNNDVNISPAINLNLLYNEYEDGTCFSDIIRKIQDIYNENRLYNNIDVEFLKDFDSVKDIIVFRIINYENNIDFLSDKPYKKFLDLALVYYYEFDLHEIEHCSICVTNNQMDTWGIREETLYELAKKNTSIIHEPQWFDLWDYISRILGPRSLEMINENKTCYNIYVITNLQKYYGAVNIINYNILDTIAEFINDDIYIIPSSVHEIIAIPKGSIPPNVDINKLIRSINLEYLSPEEVLSENLYLYDFKTKQLEISAKIRSIG